MLVERLKVCPNNDIQSNAPLTQSYRNLILSSIAPLWRHCGRSSELLRPL